MKSTAKKKRAKSVPDKNTKFSDRPSPHTAGETAVQRRKVRYAAVGLGYISQTAFLPAFRHASENSELVALVSGDPKKLRDLGRRYQVDQLYAYEDYETLLMSGEIDAIYLATPNSTHMTFAVLALQHGIHVLCEKPMEIDESACLEMIQASEETGAKLMIAYRLHYEAANLDAIKLAQSQKLGEIRAFSSVFSVNVKDRNNIRLQRAMGGGPLYDIGIYCINAARYLFRDEPTEVFAMSASRDDERFREVDEMTAAILRFPNERLASFTVSFGATDTSSYELIGTEGKLRLESAYDYATPMFLETTIGGKTTRKKYPKRDQFGPEVLAFSKAILQNQPICPAGDEGLADVHIIRALLESVASGVPISIASVRPGLRPTPDQAITKPGITPPKLVHAVDPGSDRHPQGGSHA